MESLYQCDLAYVQAVAFETLARGAAPEIIRRLQNLQYSSPKSNGRRMWSRAINKSSDVTGVDTSAELLELARVNVPTAHFVQSSIYDAEIRDYDAVVAVGEPLTYHAEDADTDNLIGVFLQRTAEALPPGGLLIFDVIGLGEPSLAGKTWSSGEDWAVLVETTENQTARTLVRDIEVFRRVLDAYRRSHEVHRVRLFDVSILRKQLSLYGFATEMSRSYGTQKLPPRRQAFFATRLGTTSS